MSTHPLTDRWLVGRVGCKALGKDAWGTQLDLCAGDYCRGDPDVGQEFAWLIQVLPQGGLGAALWC